MKKVMKRNFTFEPDNSKCKCLEDFLHAVGRTERMDIEPAGSTAEGTTLSVYTEEEVKEAVEKKTTHRGR